MTRLDPPSYHRCGDEPKTPSGVWPLQPQFAATSVNSKPDLSTRKPYEWQLELQRATSSPNLRAAAGTSSAHSKEGYNFYNGATVFSTFAVDDGELIATGGAVGTDNLVRSLNQVNQPSHLASNKDNLNEELPAYEGGGGSQVVRRGPVDKEVAQAPPTGTAFHCQRCKEAVNSSDRIAQIPTCDHIVCVQCLSFHIVKELGASRYPVECPVCITAETKKDLRGIVSASVAGTCSLPPLALEAFHDFQLSQHSTRVTCPQCLNNMLLERVEYMQENVIVCPLPDCGHRWCKQCQKQMPTSPVSVAKHTCKPCDGRVCPGCGALGKRPVSSNNHIRCKELGCGMHYCYECGDPIGQEGITPNLDGAIVAHSKRCGSKRYCTIM